MKLAIIGGTNIATLPIPYTEEAVSTPYGDAVVYHGTIDGTHEVLFLSRHGVLKDCDAAHVNYRKNIYALKSVGATHVIGLTAVSSCDYNAHAGDICLFSDFIDFTKSRPSSFNIEHRLTRHTSMDEVFDNGMNDAIEKVILEKNLPYAGRAVAACTEGPRFETAAEVRMLRALGAQVICKTVAPEAPLAREIGLKYSALALITSRATGMADEVSDKRIVSVMESRRNDVFETLFETIRRIH
ncbi:MAG: MTAP family purine nucleoside phosphorylase [Clostridia bacterium]|nr:MTAP family purine nucleoside phosphorylase [Clostridia bacterium]